MIERTVKPDVTIAVATLNAGIETYKPPSCVVNGECELLVIHQVSTKYLGYDFSREYKRLQTNVPAVKIVPSTNLGLSKSRNLAIQEAETKYIVFSDDDNGYIPKLSKAIHYYMEQLGHPAVISFMIHDDAGRPFKTYSNKLYRQTRMSILRISSIENVVDREFLIDKRISFDETFGLGALYPSCEQPIFFNEVMKAGGTLYFVPIPFAIHPLENSGAYFYVREMVAARRAMFNRVFGWKGVLMFFLFSIKKLKDVPGGRRLEFIKFSLGKYE